MLFKEDQLYNQREVAERLRVTPWTVWRLCRDGVLPPALPGMKLYSGAALQRVISTLKPWQELQEDAEADSDPDTSGGEDSS